MKKAKNISLVAVAILLNSCVYSLFPIYTEDTLVFKKELVGKWESEDRKYTMLFEEMGSDGDPVDEEDDDEYKYVVEIKDGFTMKSNDPIFITNNGKKVYDIDSIKLIMNQRLNGDRPSEKKEEKESDPIMETVVTKAKDKLKDKEFSYEGSVTVFEEKSYQLTITDDKKEETFVAHLVEIGDDLFMDLYPIKEFRSESVSDNYFPVHTFYKVSVDENEFKMTYFDLDKLNKLFESNLIRLRHENVEGSILITAQPEELQKFIDKYSDDESVFDATETLRKAS